MDPRVIVAIVVVLVLGAAAVAVLLWERRRRTLALKSRFGPEYDRALHTAGDVKVAEAELEAREKRVARFPIRSLSNEDRMRFTNAWREVQTRFVDDPKGAVVDADRLVKEVLVARGYPVSDFEQRAADISVDHPLLVSHYRAACDVARRSAAGEAGTEDLRQAFVHYRELFSDLLETDVKRKAVSR